MTAVAEAGSVLIYVLHDIQELDLLLPLSSTSSSADTRTNLPAPNVLASCI